MRIFIFFLRPAAYHVNVEETGPSPVPQPTWDSVKKRIASAGAKTSPATLINVNIDNDLSEATRSTLDQLAPKHPVPLVCTCGHFSILNSLFMRKVGIAVKEPDPGGGYYTRDGDARLAGRSVEYANFRLHATLRHLTPEREQLRVAQRMFRDAIPFGITTVQVMAIDS
jgi:predicted amidohydrolase YtcJ